MSREIEDGVFLCDSTGVLHRARIWYDSEKARTACGQRIDYHTRRLHTDGTFDEGYCRWLSRQDGRPYSLCCHCRDREPVWERWARETASI